MQRHTSHRLAVWLMAPALLAAGLLQVAKAEPAAPVTWKDQRELLLRLSQQQQLRLQQQVLCLQKAGNTTDLERCRTVVMPGWMHGPGLGGWGCPMW